jgi:predicted transcriptional regulator
MSAHINYQTIMAHGKPVFAVVPYQDFMRLIGPTATIPHEVVGLVVKKNYSLLRAWREHLGITQEEMARRLHVKQAAVSQQEAPDKKPRRATLEKWAAALGVNVEQLREQA